MFTNIPSLSERKNTTNKLDKQATGPKILTKALPLPLSVSRYLSHLVPTKM